MIIRSKRFSVANMTPSNTISINLLSTTIKSLPYYNNIHNFVMNAILSPASRPFSTRRAWRLSAGSGPSNAPTPNSFSIRSTSEDRADASSDTSTSASHPPYIMPRPAKTVEGAVAQARSALRLHRERPPPLPPGQSRHFVTIQLPILLPSQISAKDGRIMFDDDQEWPGGEQQWMRYLKPHIDDLLAGYSPTFVGLVETPEDGVGVWTFGGGDATCIANANAQTFQGFARVCEGDFGAAVLQSGHTIVAVNCAFGPAKDIGQLWDRKLKRRAKALVEDCAWTPLFVCRPIRSPSGALGLLHYVWPGSYEVFCLKSGEPSELEDTEAPVLVRAGSAGPPSSREIFEALDARWEQIPAAERPRGLTMGGLWKGLW